MGVHEHKSSAPRVLSWAVLTVSDTRDESTDQSGAVVRGCLEDAGHLVRSYRVISDDPDGVVGALRELVADDAVDIIVTNGGTGVAPRDNTYDAVASLLSSRLDGFGELFRALSYQEVGSAAMLSRAVAGLIGTTAIFTLPGSTAACRLAMEKLILPEVGHLVGLANPQKWSRSAKR